MQPKMYEAAKSGDFNSLITIISRDREDLFHQITPKENNILQRLSRPSPLCRGNYKGDTPLHVAAKVGRSRTVRVFTTLAKSLHWVVENELLNACKRLLRKQSLHKDTTPYYATRGGHNLVVKLLIEEDPHLCDITNVADESPLYFAKDQGLSSTTKLILGALLLSSSHKGLEGLTVESLIH